MIGEDPALNLGSCLLRSEADAVARQPSAGKQDTIEDPKPRPTLQKVESLQLLRVALIHLVHGVLCERLNPGEQFFKLRRGEGLRPCLAEGDWVEQHGGIAADLTGAEAPPKEAFKAALKVCGGCLADAVVP